MEFHPVSKKIHPGPAPLRTLFFVCGITATIAYRITPFLTPLWVKVAWYVGTVGFIIYFWHRAQVEAKRANLVKDYQLVDVLEKSTIVGNPEQKSAIFYLIKTSLTSKSRYNSAFIVIVSLLALVVSIFIDLNLYI